MTITAETAGWSAQATHTALAAAEGCVIFLGTVDAKPSIGSVTAEKDGVVVCTE